MPVYSHSKLQSYENCPQKYKFQYIDRVELPEGGEGIEAFVGSRVHEVLEKLYKELILTKLNNLEDLLAYYESQWDKNWHDDVVVREGFTPEHYRNTGKDAIESYYKRHYPFKQGKTLATEQLLTFKIDNYTIRGFVDRLSYSGKGSYAVRKRYGKRWLFWCARGKKRLQNAAGKMTSKCAAALLALSNDELAAVLVGKYPQLAGRLTKSLKAREQAIKSASEELRITSNLFERRAIRRRINDLRATLSPLASGKKIHPVECYTSHEGRTDRDRHAAAFREIGPPWVLVASNVGSEGIDLHTYTARIIHYDLEWNPAKMEQREGRGDRVGRLLKDRLMILYCLVPRTYDERMFHQLVARDRWHGVLLGKPSCKLSDDAIDAPLIDQSLMKKTRLDLAPRT